jgi:ubiquinone/menaquinone biosynthesis C-methylase UbiE
MYAVKRKRVEHDTCAVGGPVVGSMTETRIDSQMSGIASPRPTRRERLEHRVRDIRVARRLRIDLALEAVERFAEQRQLDVLDAGCGEGLLTERLAERHPGWRIVAADVDAEQLEKARRNAARVGLANVRFVQADLTRDLGDSVYDVVTAIECLSEIPDDDDALASMARALQPGGLFLAHVPERSWEPVLPGGQRTWRLEVRHGYSAEELMAKCERVGLTDVAVTPTARSTIWLAEDIANRVKNASLKKRLLAYPPLATAARLERLGITWGKARALMVEARRP